MGFRNYRQQRLVGVSKHRKQIVTDNSRLVTGSK